jgi:hypothetical protein
MEAPKGLTFPRVAERKWQAYFLGFMKKFSDK